MRIKVTEKFLWDVYKILEPGRNVSLFLNNSYKASYNNLRNFDIVSHYKKEMGRKEFSRLIYYLKQRGYIEINILKGKKAVLLTNKGVSKAIKASFSYDNKIKRKDGKWIMLMFDIPTQNRKARVLMRSVLNNLGYKLFQHSVWVTPYDIHEKTEKLLGMYSLDRYVKIFLIEAM